MKSCTYSFLFTPARLSICHKFHSKVKAEKMRVRLPLKSFFGGGCQNPFSSEETGATVTYITRMKYLKFTN